VAGKVERRREERRSGRERRSSARTDPLPQRAQLRRQADVLAHLGSTDEKEAKLAQQFACLDARAILF
jgi:hypothetical protein